MTRSHRSNVVALRRRPATGRLLTFLAVVEVWLGRRRQRRALLELNDYMLKDIGLSRCDALCEGGKPFWRG